VLDRDPVAERIDEVPGRARPGRIEAGAPKPEGVEHTAAQGVLVAGLAPPRDDLAEQAEGEVGVMPRLARPQHALGVLQPADQLLAGGRPQRLPDLAGGLALQAAQVRQPVGYGRPCRRFGEVRPQGIAEVEHHRVAQLEDADGGERLCDRADAVGVLGGRGLSPLDVGHSERTTPDHLAVAEDGRAHRR
jgi:hypothetical protein